MRAALPVVPNHEGERAYRETTLRSRKPIVLVADDDDCNITSNLEAVFSSLND
jgi:hypothetical protein